MIVNFRNELIIEELGIPIVEWKLNRIRELKVLSQSKRQK